MASVSLLQASVPGRPANGRRVSPIYRFRATNGSNDRASITARPRRSTRSSPTSPARRVRRGASTAGEHADLERRRASSRHGGCGVLGTDGRETDVHPVGLRRRPRSSPTRRLRPRSAAPAARRRRLRPWNARVGLVNARSPRQIARIARIWSRRSWRRTSVASWRPIASCSTAKRDPAPRRTDAEADPPRRQRLQRVDRARQLHRVTVVDVGDQHAEVDALGHRGQRAQDDERIARERLIGDRAAEVIGHPQRADVGRVDLAGESDERRRVGTEQVGEHVDDHGRVDRAIDRRPLPTSCQSSSRRANSRCACSAAFARISSPSTRVGRPPASTARRRRSTSMRPHAGGVREPPRIDRRVRPRHPIVQRLGEQRPVRVRATTTRWPGSMSRRARERARTRHGTRRACRHRCRRCRARPDWRTGRARRTRRRCSCWSAGCGRSCRADRGRRADARRG